MRQPQLLKQPPNSRRRNSGSTSIPAPVGGWNARDSIADMPPTDAIIMLNWWPSTGSVEFRRGWREYVTGITGQVESLMPYNAISGNNQLFAAANNSFYDVSSTGEVGAAVVAGNTNNRWQSVNFTNTSAISYLCCFNGVDLAQYYDGTNWIEIDSMSTPGITGVVTSTLNNPWVHKRRLWMVEENSLSAWYLPVDAVGGAATEFSLYGLFKRGGRLVAGGTWTIDGGEGLDDYCVFVSSEGEVALYKGSTPESFTIAGIWRIGEPIGTRCLLKYSGDLLIICKDGVFPLSAALQSSETNPRASITDKIDGAMSTATQIYGSNFGWNLEFFPGGDMLILNVPITEGADQEQYAMNTITGAWARFTGVNANCWAILDGQPYFGGNGYVGQFWQKYNDNGENIEYDLLQAYSYFGDRGGLKRWSLIRPIFGSNGTPTLLADLNVDYMDERPASQITFTPTIYGVWDSALWSVDLWGGGVVITREWQSVAAFGTSAALRLVAESQGVELSFQASDYVYEKGGVV